MIGVDIGGTKVKAGIVNVNGHILAQLEEPTDKKDLKNQLLRLIESLLNQNPKIDGIGIATAGRVNVNEGSIYDASANLPGWTGTKVKEIVENQFHIHTVVDNDANCAAYAEMKVGGAAQHQNFMCITLGTGVGAGIILNGQLYHGEKGGAGEIGHMNFFPNGRPCNCGKIGCWEQYVSGTALTLDINEHEALNSIHPMELFKLASENHPIAVEIVDRFVTNLAIGIVSVQSILDLNCFVIGGGVINSSQYWWESFLQKMKAITDQPPHVSKVKLLNDAGMLGAALMASEGITESRERRV